jgi:hypothetical protein
MKLSTSPAVLITLILLVPALNAGDANPSSAHLSKENRIDLIRTFTADLVYIRATFPMGNDGLTLKNGSLSPTGQKLQQEISLWGPSVKPGDRAIISSIEIKKDRIRFEINGGPIRKKKWYQHIEVGMGNNTAPIAPSDPNANPRGTFVDLVFDHYVPDLTAQRAKDLLEPVFDFNSKNGLEAYLETVPPKVKAAIKNHQVLVGMNREMVVYAKGLAPNKIREKDSTGTEYEEWIYGEPPQDVDFIRFVGDDVVRVETMKVDGEKIVRTQREVDLPNASVVAKAPAAEAPPANAPTLRRPGEDVPDPQSSGAQDPNQPGRLPTSPPIPDGAPGSAPPNQGPNHVASHS